MSVMRSYSLAFELSLETTEQLALCQEELEGALGEAGVASTWVEPSQLRVGLKWLGEVEGSLLERVEEAVGHVTAALVPFKVDVRGPYGWPSASSPRLVHGSVVGGRDLVSGLQQVMEVHLERIGVPVDPREFRPWVVLGRVRGSAARADLSPWLEGPAELGSSVIRHVALYQAELDRWGVRRRVVRRFRLGGERVEGRRV